MGIMESRWESLESKARLRSILGAEAEYVPITWGYLMGSRNVEKPSQANTPGT